MRYGIDEASVFFFDSFHLGIDFGFLVYPEAAEAFKEANFVAFAEALNANQLDIVTPEDIQGVVKLTPNGNWNIKLTSKTVDKSLYKSYSAKMLIYLASDGDTIDLKAVHDGKVTLSQIQTNSWVTIEVPAYQDGDQNDLYDVFDWFDGSTGWLQGGTDVTAVYVAGVWLESPTQA